MNSDSQLTVMVFFLSGIVKITQLLRCSCCTANSVVKPATTTLNVGKNSFRYVFTPDAGYIPEKDMVMSSYEPIEGTLL